MTQRPFEETLRLALEYFESETEPTYSEIAERLDVTTNTAINYVGRAWRLWRSGKKPRRMRYPGAPLVPEETDRRPRTPGAPKTDTDEEAERRLKERLLRKPDAGELREALERLGGNGKHREPPPARPLREAPSFGGFTLSREALVERLAAAFARIAGHQFFDELPDAKQAGFMALGERAVLALELVEADLNRVAMSKTAAGFRVP